jgi:nitronate monooxygenase
VIIAGVGHPQAGPLVEERIAVCFEERVPVLVLFWGDPAPFVGEARRSGTKLLVQVGSVEGAAAAAEAGVDAVIAQGARRAAT